MIRALVTKLYLVMPLGGKLHFPGGGVFGQVSPRNQAPLQNAKLTLANRAPTIEQWRAPDSSPLTTDPFSSP